MNAPTRRLALAAAMLAVGLLAAGCGQSGSIKKAVSSLLPSRSVSAPSFSLSAKAPKPTAPALPAASAPAPSHSAAANGAGSPGESGSSLLWLWILLGALVLVIVIGAVLIARRSGHRSDDAARWRTKVADACAKGSALYDAMSLAEAPSASTEEGHDARWTDIQRRADDLTQTLYALRESAPGEEERARVADVLASLQSVRSAMSAENTPGGAAAHQGRVQGLLQSFDASLRVLCSSNQ